VDCSELLQAGQRDLASLGQLDGTCLKAGVAEQQSTVGPNVADDGREGGDIHLAHGEIPVPALD
jgi:hypothetical protein